MIEASETVYDFNSGQGTLHYAYQVADEAGFPLSSDWTWGWGGTEVSSYTNLQSDNSAYVECADGGTNYEPVIRFEYTVAEDVDTIDYLYYLHNGNAKIGSGEDGDCFVANFGTSTWEKICDMGNEVDTDCVLNVTASISDYVNVDQVVMACEGLNFDKSGELKSDYAYLKVGWTIAIIPPYNITECQTISIPAQYHLKNNIINSEENTCFLIDTENVTLDCHSFTIDGTDTVSTVGIQIDRTGTLVAKNITVKNCNISDWANGINTIDINDSFFINNSLVSNDDGFWLTASNNNNIFILNSSFSHNQDDSLIHLGGKNFQIMQSTFIESDNGLRFSNLVENPIIKDLVFINHSDDALSLAFTINAIVSNLTINRTKRTGHGISVAGDNASVTNVTILNAGIPLILNGDSNQISNINIQNCTGTLGCVWFFFAYNNSLQNIYINNSKSFGFNFQNSNGTIVKDSIVYNTDNSSVRLLSGSIANFTNVTYTSENISNKGAKLIRKWYFNVNVTADGLPLQGANISVYNKSNDLVFNQTTKADGTIDRVELIEYINTSGTAVYWTPYNITANNSGELDISYNNLNFNTIHNISFITIGGSVCDCPTGEDWVIDDGTICYIETDCFLPNYNLLVSNGGWRLAEGTTAMVNQYKHQQGIPFAWHEKSTFIFR